jgi:uncharacterized protein (UPF0210 family)
MRRLLFAILAVTLLGGTASATEKDVVVNVLDKLIALVNDYTKRADEALSMEELQAVYVGFEQAMASFSKDNADEIAKFDAHLTDKVKENYEAELSKAMKLFQAALEKKAGELLGDKDSEQYEAV